jgi:hypothetical protein
MLLFLPSAAVHISGIESPLELADIGICIDQRFNPMKKTNEKNQ